MSLIFHSRTTVANTYHNNSNQSAQFHKAWSNLQSANSTAAQTRWQYVAAHLLQQRGLRAAAAAALRLLVLDGSRRTTGTALVLLILQSVRFHHAAGISVCKRHHHAGDVAPSVHVTSYYYDCFCPCCCCCLGLLDTSNCWHGAQVFVMGKCRSRRVNSCCTEVTNKALDQYLFSSLVSVLC